MENPAAIGLSALVFGAWYLSSTVGSLLAADAATSLDGLGAAAGTIGGCALALVGVAILRGWGEFDPERDGVDA